MEVKVDKERLAEIIGTPRHNNYDREDEVNMQTAEAVLEYLTEVRVASSRERLEEQVPNVWHGTTRIDAAAAVISVLDYPEYTPDWHFAERVAKAMDEADAKRGIRRYSKADFDKAVNDAAEQKAYEYHESECLYKRHWMKTLFINQGKMDPELEGALRKLDQIIYDATTERPFFGYDTDDEGNFIGKPTRDGGTAALVLEAYKNG